MKKVLLTGATGFLGGELLVLLSKKQDIEKIYCLVRANSTEEAVLRIAHVFELHGDFFDRSKVIPILGNMMDEFLCDKLRASKELEEVNIVVHSAANTSFSRRYDNMVKKTNIGGTNQILEWSKSLKNLEMFVYVGTATICGKDTTNRVIFEDESPDENAHQLVTYSYTKSVGEINVRAVIPTEKLLVVRPSIIMGDSRNIIPRSYVIMWAFASFELMRIIPMHENLGLDIVPVDYTAEAIVNLMFCCNRHYDTYHISAGKESATTMGMIMSALEDSKNGPPCRFVPYESVAMLRKWSRNRLDEHDPFFAGNVAYFVHMKEKLGHNGNLRILLGALDAYYRFGNLGQVFDNARMIDDTGMSLPEPAHIYMGRSKHLLANIDVLEGALDP